MFKAFIIGAAIAASSTLASAHSGNRELDKRLDAMQRELDASAVYRGACQPRQCAKLYRKYGIVDLGHDTFDVAR